MPLCNTALTLRPADPDDAACLYALAAQVGKPVQSLQLFERRGCMKINDSGMPAILEWRPRP